MELSICPEFAVKTFSINKQGISNKDRSIDSNPYRAKYWFLDELKVKDRNLFSALQPGLITPRWMRLRERIY